MSNTTGKNIDIKSRSYPRKVASPPKVVKMPITLSEFMKQDMDSRKLYSDREYAHFVGCAPSTIGEYLRGKEPTIDFLRKYAKATKVSLRDLLIISFPEITTPDDIDPQWRLLYARYKNLPESVQDFILRAMSMVEK